MANRSGLPLGFYRPVFRPQAYNLIHHGDTVHKGDPMLHKKEIVNQWISNLFLILRIKSSTVFLFHSKKQGQTECCSAGLGNCVGVSYSAFF
jgi:hypothetical protein